MTGENRSRGAVPGPAKPAGGRTGRVGGVGVRGGAGPGQIRPRRCTHSPFTASSQERYGFDSGEAGGGWAGRRRGQESKWTGTVSNH